MPDLKHTLTADDLALAATIRRAFDDGRAICHARAAAALATRTNAIRIALDRDLVAALPARGRATRIARQLHMKRRTVSRIVASLVSVANLDRL